MLIKVENTIDFKKLEADLIELGYIILHDEKYENVCDLVSAEPVENDAA